MNVARILELSYFDTNSNKDNFITNYWIDKLNEIYKKVWRAIVKKYKDYFWNYWTTDLQAGIVEYAIQRKEVNLWTDEDPDLVPGIAVLQKVKIKTGEKLDDDGETIIPIYELLPELSDAQWEAGYKWWQLKDNHIVLSWIPKEDMEDWIKLEGVQAINNLTEESGEDEIFPGHEDLIDFTEVIKLWLDWKLWRWKHDFDKANLAKAEFDEALVEAINSMWVRTDTIFYSELQY